MAAIRITLPVLTAAMSSSFHGLWTAVHEHPGQTPRAELRDLFARLPALTNQDDLKPMTPADWQPS